MELTNYCRQLAQACKEGGEWVVRNQDLVRNEQESLLKELRRAGRAFRSLGRAAGRKMCAGVFGPSQAGKSYLISALARDANNRLNAVFGAETYDFISEINPEGGKESTGLVTRFTMTRPQNAPAGFPVRISLLSETDLVKILANTWFADCEHKEEAQSNIQAAMDALAARVQPGESQKDCPVDLDALEDLREYLLRNFRSRAQVMELEHSFWDRALTIGPRLSLEDRVSMYGLIWDGTEEFTNLLRKLLQALGQLGFADQAFCGLDALIPRKNSIIDVATLEQLGQDAPELELVSTSGSKARLPRSLVTALTAELTVVMENSPADYFEHTDLLDFPGYRSRYKLDDVRRELEKEPKMLKELFLRGKVAYLFQRYCAERELTSMLLCIGSGPQEVQDLPLVINDWIGGTHGATPEEREGKDVSLFLILTKFDMEFEDKKGAPSVAVRWDNRLKSSLLDFFGKQHDWPTDWSPRRSFDNTFFLRNPNFRFDSILDYDGDAEKGVRSERQEYVNRLKEAFLASPLVTRHFRDPARAWSEAMRLNDGGISYIRESLSPLCNPELKKRQLLQNIENIRKSVERRLRSFYQTDDSEEKRKQKLLLIRNIFSRLGNLEEKQKRFGRLLQDFTISDTEIYDLAPEAHRRYLELGEKKEQPEETPPAEDINIDEVDLAAWNPFSEDADRNAPEKKAADRQQDEAAFFASFIEGAWVQRLRQLCDDAASQHYYLLPEQDFAALVGEITTGAARMDLAGEMADAFRKASAYANTRHENIVRRQAGIAAHIINSYVDWLGSDPHRKDAAQRTLTLPGGKKTLVFEHAEPGSGLPQLAETRSPWTRRWLSDWLNALAVMIMDNVNFDGRKSINVAENDALRGILRELAPQKN